MSKLRKSAEQSGNQPLIPEPQRREITLTESSLVNYFLCHITKDLLTNEVDLAVAKSGSKLWEFETVSSSGDVLGIGIITVPESNEHGFRPVDLLVDSESSASKFESISYDTDIGQYVLKAYANTPQQPELVTLERAVGIADVLTHATYVPVVAPKL